MSISASDYLNAADSQSDMAMKAGDWPALAGVSGGARPEHRLPDRSAGPADPSSSHFAAARCHADEAGNPADVTGGCPDGTH
jgi:hypothetical protein